VKINRAKVKLTALKNYSINSLILEDTFSNSSYTPLVFILSRLFKLEFIGSEEYAGGFSQ